MEFLLNTVEELQRSLKEKKPSPIVAAKIEFEESQKKLETQLQQKSEEVTNLAKDNDILRQEVQLLSKDLEEVTRKLEELTNEHESLLLCLADTEMSRRNLKKLLKEKYNEIVSDDENDSLDKLPPPNIINIPANKKDETFKEIVLAKTKDVGSALVSETVAASKSIGSLLQKPQHVVSSGEVVSV